MYDWSELLRLAYEEGKKSRDPSTRNGALLYDEPHGLILSKGFNHFPTGVLETEERWQRPLKYKFIVHAEVDVLYKARRKGMTLVCPWAACTECAKAMIEFKVRKLVTHKQAHDCSHGDWKQEVDLAFQMFKEARVEVMMYDGLVGVSDVLHNGVLYDR